MLLPPHPHPHRRHPRPHTHHNPRPHTRRHPRRYTRRHHWFPGQTSSVPSWAVVAGWRWRWHRDRRFHHIQLRDP